MRKILLTTLVICASMITANSQVGINQKAPKASLDVTASTGANIPDGVLVPRLSLSALKAKNDAYQIPQHGALIYMSDYTNESPFGKTINVKSNGFYFYTQTTASNGVWVPLVDIPTKPDVITVIAGNVNYNIKGTEDIIIFKGATVEQDMVFDLNGYIPPIGKKIYMYNHDASRKFIVGQTGGVKGNAALMLWEKTMSVLMYVGSTDGIPGDWVYTSGGY